MFWDDTNSWDLGYNPLGSVEEIARPFQLGLRTGNNLVREQKCQMAFTIQPTSHCIENGLRGQIIMWIVGLQCMLLIWRLRKDGTSQQRLLCHTSARVLQLKDILLNSACHLSLSVLCNKCKAMFFPDL